MGVKDKQKLVYLFHMFHRFFYNEVSHMSDYSHNFFSSKHRLQHFRYPCKYLMNKKIYVSNLSLQIQEFSDF